MSPARRTSSRRRRPKRATPTAAELWRPVPQLPEPERIVRADDPTAVLRSLGDPPLQGQAAVAEHYLAAVVERAADVATALAAAAGLLGELDDESETPTAGEAPSPADPDAASRHPTEAVTSRRRDAFP